MSFPRKQMLALLAAGAGLYLANRLRRRTDYSFRDKVALITGGSRGLGLVLARQLAEEGASLVICARDPRELRRAAEELASLNAEVLALECDITDESQVDELVRTTLERRGRIDVLINNAGIIQTGPLETMTQDDYEQSMKVHFWGPLYTTRAVLPHMTERGQGRIVNITSIGGKVSVPHLVPYSASKFALVGFSEGLRAELAKFGVIVTTVVPGLMRTGSPRNALFKGRHRLEYAWFSISDSIPGLSIGVERAARQILNACRRGDAEVMLSLPTKLAVAFHGLFPGLTSDLLSYFDRLLPGNGGIGTATARGYESTSAWSPSWLTTLTEKAAVKNNEVR